jgi:hypothetical protein
LCILIIFLGKALEDEKTIKHYGIKNGCIIYMAQTKNESDEVKCLTIFVKMEDEEDVELEVYK